MRPNPMARKLILAYLLSGFCMFGDEVIWTWATPNFTPCPGIGIHGSYSVTARGNMVTDSSGAKIMNQVTVFAASPVFSPDKASITAQLDITSVPAPTQSILLAPAGPGTISEAPGPNETPRLYLPVGTTVPIAANTKFRFTISATVQDDSGASCAVGSTTKDIDPNQPADSAKNRAPGKISKKGGTLIKKAN